MKATVERLRHSLRQRGLAATATRAAARATARVYRREHHFWYSLEPAAERPRPELPAGLELVRGGHDELALLERLPTTLVPDAERQLAGGAEYYLVVDGGTPAFACWIFRDRAPLLAGRDGWLSLPGGVVILEDSVTAAAFRGRGIAPAAWSSVADLLARAGVETMITKVTSDNLAVQRALEKAGFRRFGEMTYTRRGGRVTVAVDADGGAAGTVVATLAR